MGEQISISGVWREALAIVRRSPSAVAVPAPEVPTMKEES
jgi:hypothetical protein